MALNMVTPDLLETKANEMRALKCSHDEATSKMRALIMGLYEIWKDDDIDAFVERYERMQSTFDEFSWLLENGAIDMNLCAQNIRLSDKCQTELTKNFTV